MKELKKAYDEIFAVIDKHKDIVRIDIEDLKEESRIHIFNRSLIEEYGYNISETAIDLITYTTLYNGSKTLYNESDAGLLTIQFFNEKKLYDGNQTLTLNGHLFVISFLNPEYVFGEYTTKTLFNDFFEELKSYGPQCVSTSSETLYFDLEKGAKIYNEYQDIFKKFKVANIERLKKFRIEKLQKEIEKLSQL